MIGKIYKARTPYYEAKTNSNKFKSRPALVIAKADMEDYVVLPVSTISHKDKIHPVYDIEINPEIYPKTNLKKISYIRTHKQTIIHRAELNGVICDLKTEYEDVYLEVLDKREQFSSEITKQALDK